MVQTTNKHIDDMPKTQQVNQSTTTQTQKEQQKLIIKTLSISTTIAILISSNGYKESSQFLLGDDDFESENSKTVPQPSRCCLHRIPTLRSIHYLL